MRDADGHDGIAPGGSGQPSVSAGDGFPAAYQRQVEEGPAPSEPFQTLANEVRIAVLVRLLAAERADETPLTFSELQHAAGADSSAGFAYHLRQLAGHFVTETDAGYVLTPAGRRAAEAVIAGTFTDGTDPTRAS